MKYFQKIEDPQIIPIAWCRFMRTSLRFFAIGLAASVVACSDLVNNTGVPLDIIDPNAIKTERGAKGLYQAVLANFSEAYAGGTDDGNNSAFTRLTGLLTDELHLVQGDAFFPEQFFERIDSRLLFTNDSKVDGVDGPYTALHRVRLASQEARGVLKKYVSTLPAALTGHLLALEGMVTVMLAELYCSGIPLSRLNFERDYTLTEGFNTEEVYQHALMLFDSAASLVADSTRLQYFVQLGRARALLGLGQVAVAREAVAAIPTGFSYRMIYNAPVGGGTREGKFVPSARFERFGDVEGGTGLPFLTGGDPRTQLPVLMNPASSLTLSSGIEARLIEAEAQLTTGDTMWLTTLNQLRTSCERVIDCPTPAPAGTGGISGLAPLEDPTPGVEVIDTASQRQRLDMVFAERAYWLFLTGRRQGDLRRLIRYYGRPANAVFPTGVYWSVSYGSFVNLPVPASERSSNPHYRGCENRDA